jgi:hypothetical protein
LVGIQLPEKYKEKFDVSRSVSIDSLSFALYVGKRQGKKKFTVSGNKEEMNLLF